MHCVPHYSAEGFALWCCSLPYSFCLGTTVRPYVRTYVRTYVFSELCSIFQYVIKRWLRALQLSGSREHKVIMVAYEYTYQDHESIHYQDYEY